MVFVLDRMLCTFVFVRWGLAPWLLHSSYNIVRLTVRVQLEGRTVSNINPLQITAVFTSSSGSSYIPFCACPNTPPPPGTNLFLTVDDIRYVTSSSFHRADSDYRKFIAVFSMQGFSVSWFYSRCRDQLRTGLHCLYCYAASLPTFRDSLSVPSYKDVANTFSPPLSFPP
jgi:hypothetical protein